MRLAGTGSGCGCRMSCNRGAKRPSMARAAAAPARCASQGPSEKRSSGFDTCRLVSANYSNSNSSMSYQGTATAAMNITEEQQQAHQDQLQPQPRPQQDQDQQQPLADEAQPQGPSNEKRPRGRPRKLPVDPSTTATAPPTLVAPSAGPAPLSRNHPSVLLDEEQDDAAAEAAAAKRPR